MHYQIFIGVWVDPAIVSRRKMQFCFILLVQRLVTLFEQIIATISAIKVRISDISVVECERKFCIAREHSK